MNAPDPPDDAARDVLERRLAAQIEARGRAEGLLLSFLEAMPLGVFVLDADGKPFYANDAAKELLGREPDPRARPDELTEAYRARVAGTDEVYPADQTPIVRALRGESATVTDLELERDDGRIPLWISAAPVADADGNIAYAVAALRDVSEEKATEQSLFRAQRMESVGRLAGGVAHDFNNILTIIFSYAHFLADSLAGNREAQDDLREILRAADHAKQLTQQLLAFSRQRVVRPQVISLNETVAAVDKMLRRLLGEDIHFATRLAPDLGNAHIDPAAFEQVLMNLAVNARDAMPLGGQLTIETHNVRLEEGHETAKGVTIVPGDYVMVAISDSGVGMPPEVQDRIFEPFYTTKGEGAGTGLGLATCYGIVKQAGGYIWVYSEIGQGTTFKVYLPRVGAPAESPSREHRVLSMAGTETILLVEDDASVRALTSRALRGFGYTVLEAYSAQHALELAEERGSEIALLITDVVMPQMSGKILGQLVATLQADIEVLYISGYTADAIVHHGVLDEGVELLQKPFTPARLGARVREILDRPRE